MSVTIKIKPKGQVINTTFDELREQVLRAWAEDLKTMSKEELAEKLTTYEPGVPHYWFGLPVAPITKEELLDFWNGGPDIEPRYLDVPEPEPIPAKTDLTPIFPKRKL